MSSPGYRNSAKRDPASGAEGSPRKSRVAVLQLTDPADAAQALGELDFDFVKLGPDRFFVKRVVVDLDGSLLAYHFTSHAGRSRTRVASPHRVVVAFSPSATGTINGREITPEMLVTARAGADSEGMSRN